ncbi:MAG: serine/threonine-protein kinase [Albidovulum sp.]
MSIAKLVKGDPDIDQPEAVTFDELSAGTQLFGDQYTITNFLHKGRFGITYMANDSLARTIVIKECFPQSICHRRGIDVLPASSAHNAEFAAAIAHFDQEARRHAKLSHPNIAKIHQVFRDNGTAYITMDYVNGFDLVEIIDEDTPIDPAVAERWLRKLLSAVKHVHCAGILHRNISPDNILITENYEPVLIDFGTAREQVAQTSRALSTLRSIDDGYSPYELHMTGGDQTETSDLYSLAATFHYMITGHPPPTSQARLAAKVQCEADTYIPLYGRIDGYPDAMLRSIDKALGVMPKDRLQSAQDWLDMLDETQPFVAAPKPKAAPTAHELDITTTKPEVFSGKLALSAITAAAALAAFVVTFGVNWIAVAPTDPPVNSTEILIPAATAESGSSLQGATEQPQSQTR